MQLKTLTAKNLTDTQKLIDDCNALTDNITFEKLDKPIGEFADGSFYHCVVISAGRDKFMKGDRWDRLVDDTITWAKRYEAPRMGIYYVDMDTYEHPVARISKIYPFKDEPIHVTLEDANKYKIDYEEEQERIYDSLLNKPWEWHPDDDNPIDDPYNDSPFKKF